MRAPARRRRGRRCGTFSRFPFRSLCFLLCARLLHPHAARAREAASLPVNMSAFCLTACSVAARASPLQARGAARRAVPSTPCLMRAPAARCTLVCARGTRQRTGVSRGTVCASAADADDEPWEIDLQVSGMVCEGCVSNVEAALAKSKGVVRVVAVDLASGIATVEVQAATAVR